jgi:hypothetical protein
VPEVFMPTPARTTVDLRIVGRHLPGLRWSCYDRIHVGVQGRHRDEVVGLVPGDADRAVFDLTVGVVADEAGVDFRGPFVQGRRGERFLYLSWGELGADGSFELFRRGKLHLSALDEGEVRRAAEGGSRIEATLDLTDERGAPVCATVQWRVLGEGS